MAKCVECGGNVSTWAKVCPHCGKPNPTVSNSQKALGCLCLPIIVIGCVYSCISSTELGNNATKADALSSTPAVKADWRQADNSIEAYLMAQNFVEKRLRSPGTAKWPGMFDDDPRGRHLGDQRYSIRSWVDAENVFGGTTRMHYDAVVKMKDADNWQLESLQFDESE